MRLIYITVIFFVLTSFVFAESRAYKGLSLDEVITAAQSHLGGRVLNASTVKRDGRTVHSVKILTESGRVKRYTVDVESGHLLD